MENESKEGTIQSEITDYLIKDKLAIMIMSDIEKGRFDTYDGGGVFSTYYSPFTTEIGYSSLFHTSRSKKIPTRDGYLMLFIQ
ncbi:hypothetical protein CN602_23325 [Bacillus cereus]|nr:hypothetical protein CN602_23325 [Bacillus cereus]